RHARSPFPPRNLDINASNYVRSTRLLSGIHWKWRLLGRVLLARHIDGPGDNDRATPLPEYPKSSGRGPLPAGRRANHVKLVLAEMMAVGTLISAGSV